MNIYFLEDGDGVVQFDAGTKAMRKAAAAEARQLGGLKRVVLGHAHADHRGTAPYLGAPVQCHPDEVADAESPASIQPYMDLSLLPVAPVRWLYPFLLRHWDGGPVKIDSTVSEGDEVAGFEVLHFPGHAPGLIGLWRESDGLALVSDVVYLVDAARLNRCPRARRASPIRPSAGTTRRPRSRCAGWRRWSRGWSRRATIGRCAATTCARRSSAPPTSSERSDITCCP